MRRILKTTIATVTAAVVMAGCSLVDESEEYVQIGGATDTILLAKQGNGFVINWSKNYSGYSEVVYTQSVATGERGDGYPFTNNVTGNYTLTCEFASENSTKAYYRCTRPDISAVSSVALEKGIEYQWLVNYGFEHRHGETQATMEYANGTLSIQ